MQAGRLPPNDHRPDAPSGAPDSTGAARAIVAILETRDLDSVDAAVAADYVDLHGLGEREIRASTCSGSSIAGSRTTRKLSFRRPS